MERLEQTILLFLQKNPFCCCSEAVFYFSLNIFLIFVLSCLKEGEPSGKRKAEDDDKASKKHKKYVISDEEEDDDD